MKKFLTFFIVLFNFYGTLQALTPEQRFAAVQKEFPKAESFITDIKNLFGYVDPSEESSNIIFQENAFVYIEGAALKAEKDALNHFFTNNPDSTLIIDFARGDGFVDNQGKITLKKEDLPPALQNLVIRNVSGDKGVLGRLYYYWYPQIDPSITKIDTCFLSNCPQLKSLDISFSKATFIHAAFTTHCTGLKSLHLSLPNLEYMRTGFLTGCTDLEYLHLYLPKVKGIEGECIFLKDCSNLIHITGLGNAAPVVWEFIITVLEKSDVPTQRDLAASLKKRADQLFEKY